MKRMKILFEPEVYQIVMERTMIPPGSSFVEEEDES